MEFDEGSIPSPELIEWTESIQQFPSPGGANASQITPIQERYKSD
jgi:hypothetical protein